MQRQLSRVITAVTCGDSCHVGRQLSRLTTAVTSKDSCHVRGQLSLVKTAGTSMLQPFIRLRFNPFQTKQCSHWSHCFQWSLSCWQNRFSVWYGSMKAVSATISCDKTDRWFGLVWFGRLRIGVHPNPLTRVQWLSQNKFLLVWLGLSFGLIRSKRRLPGVIGSNCDVRGRLTKNRFCLVWFDRSRGLTSLNQNRFSPRDSGLVWPGWIVPQAVSCHKRVFGFGLGNAITWGGLVWHLSRDLRDDRGETVYLIVVIDAVPRLTTTPPLSQPHLKQNRFSVGFGSQSANIFHTDTRQAKNCAQKTLFTLFYNFLHTPFTSLFMHAI